jgi:hypothetical protein
VPQKKRKKWGKIVLIRRNIPDALLLALYCFTARNLMKSSFNYLHLNVPVLPNDLREEGTVFRKDQQEMQ